MRRLKVARSGRKQDGALDRFRGVFCAGGAWKFTNFTLYTRGKACAAIWRPPKVRARQFAMARGDESAAEAEARGGARSRRCERTGAQAGMAG
jgi:hypothetical protein